MNESELINEGVTILESKRVLLRNYRIELTRDSDRRKGGVLDIIPTDGKTTEGVLYRVPDGDITKISKKEGVCVDAYEPIIISVENCEGRVINSVISYQVCKKIDAKPASKEYKDSVLRGACEHVLPEQYRAKLKAVLKKREV